MSVGRKDIHAGARVLVVDDEANITDLVAMALRYQGFSVAIAHNGTDALTAAQSFRPDLVVLDIMLPDLDGFEVFRRMDERGMHTPVLFLTARDATEDKIRGLTMGADDYVTKPFSLEELVARVRGILRRTGAEASKKLKLADLTMDEDAHQVRRGDEEIDLTPTEFSLLRYLLINAGRVVSKAQILDHVWHYDFGGDANVVETYVSYLRKKIDRFDPPLIQTVRGIGYTMRVTE